MKLNFSELKPYLMLFGGIFLASAVVVGAAVGINSINENGQGPEEFRTFSSCTSMASYINENYEEPFYPYFDDFALEESADVDSLSGAQPTQERTSLGSDGEQSQNSDFSTTNVQVEGVDESDILKSDGEIAYYIVNNEVVVIDISEPSEPTELTRLEFDENPQQLFLQGDSLVIQSQEYNYYRSISADGSEDLNATHVYLFDVSDPEEPELTKDVALQGSFYNARKIDNYVYVINTAYFYNDGNFTSNAAEESIPKLAIVEDDEVTTDRAANCSDISYFGNSASAFVAVTAIDIESSDVTSKVMIGNTSNIYMSQENLYLATTTYIDEEDGPTDWEDIFETEDILPAANPDTYTEIIKLSVDGTDLKFKAANKVPGTVKNQFSMDEYYEHLRVTTTLNDWFGWGNDSSNNLYVLDEDMELAGSVEGLAEGERIYSTRFFGDTAYVVTFRQVDPLFVIDLSDASNPEVLGELKIPGFSDYLHIYDENHVIGVGMDADENSGRTEGVKVSLFDVTNPTEPTVLSDIVLGGRGSNTTVSQDHKAFLFDREKELMVVPVSLQAEDSDSFFYSEPEFAGFIVFDINIENGISERGRVDFTEEGNYDYWNQSARSMYVNNNLLTFMDYRLKSSDLDTLEEFSSLNLLN